jgi:glycerol-3-phosphate O-acyltransferase / dihydroxyacetone phosphate acyltransferase
MWRILAAVSLGRFGSPVYWAARMVLGGAARVYFRSIDVRHRERVPRGGPLLVVANHPASFTDVIVLSLAIPRHLHFLAMAPIFQPWIRGFALRLCGTLPIYRRRDDPGLMQRNDDTFRACHEFLDRGGAVLIFPEGTSLEDRRVVQVKTGAARIALGQEARPGQEGRLTLLPVGLHFAERTGFWTDVVVSVGQPIDLAPFRELARGDQPEAVRALTAEIQLALERLILKLEVDRVALVHAIEEIYKDEVALAPGDSALDRARAMAECVEYFARTDPDRVALASARIERYQDRLSALRVRDHTVREMLPPEGRIRERVRLVLLGLLGLFPALAGGAIHYLPYRASAAAGGAAQDPTRVAAYRIAVGVVVFPLLYGALALWLARVIGWAAQQVAAALVLTAALGLHALLYFNWLTRQWQRIRLVLLAMSHRRLVARLRRDRRALIRMFETSLREYRAATGRGS